MATITGQSAAAGIDLAVDDSALLALYPEMGLTAPPDVSAAVAAQGPELATAPANPSEAWVNFDLIADSFRDHLRLARDRLHLLMHPD